MRIALIADIHSNLLALEAVIAAIKKHRPDSIISLGDQVNLGPAPKETLDLLHAHGITCLHGNHERYILSAMDGHPGYAGANFDTLRYNAGRLTREEITFPKTLDIEGITFCHALPEDDRFPVYDHEKAIPLLRAMNFDKPTHIICGHGHNPTYISLPNLRIESIGSAGCMDDGVPGTAPYAILTMDHGDTFLRPYYVSYPTEELKALYIRCGMAEECPIMARIACLQMMHNQDYLIRFVAIAQEMSRQRGETCISPKTWADTDAAFDWPDKTTTQAFWKR